MMAKNTQDYSAAALELLKANLGFFDSQIPEALESYLESLLSKAFSDFGEMNIMLQPGNLSHDFDQAAYAAWLYRNGPTGAGKPEMIKSIIRNRQVNNALNSPEESA